MRLFRAEFKFGSPRAPGALHPIEISPAIGDSIEPGLPEGSAACPVRLFQPDGMCSRVDRGIDGDSTRT